MARAGSWGRGVTRVAVLYARIVLESREASARAVDVIPIYPNLSQAWSLDHAIDRKYVVDFAAVALEQVPAFEPIRTILGCGLLRCEGAAACESLAQTPTPIMSSAWSQEQ